MYEQHSKSLEIQVILSQAYNEWYAVDKAISAEQAFITLNALISNS